MKKLISLCILLFCMSMLVGCGKKNGEPNDKSDYESEPLDFLDLSGLDEFANRDNTLDAYSAVVNEVLEVEHPANAISGGGGAMFFSEGKGHFMKKHLFANPKECWDEIAITDEEGNRKSIRLDVPTQVVTAGAVIGSDHFLYQTYTLDEDEKLRWHVMETDESLTVIRDIPLDCIDSENWFILDNLVMDSAGNLHFILAEATYSENTEKPVYQYMVITKEGELLFSVSEKPDWRYISLLTLANGKIVLVEEEHLEGEVITYDRNYLCYDAESGECELLFALQCDYKTPTAMTLWDEETILYANNNGLYQCDLNMENVKLLYLFRNHGISTAEVYELQAFSDGSLQVIYRDQNDVLNFLRLVPTVGQKEIPSILLAVGENNAAAYKKAVAAFNKRYPSYHVELVDNYDETKLLTELIAGDGPVLVDTALSGFEDKQKLWLPLDTVLEQLGVKADLEPKVLETGKINGTLYGVVPGFSIQTVVTGDPDVKGWNYEQFIQAIQKQKCTYICENLGIGSSAGFLSTFFSHSLDDSYYLKQKGESRVFDAKAFEKVLTVAMEFQRVQETVYPGQSLLDGEVFCNVLTISNPEELALYRICYGENSNYIGFPTKNGAVNYLTAAAPLTIRKSASEEEKKLACLFLKSFLSYEGQQAAITDTRLPFSVRKDVLEEQFARVTKESSATAFGFEQIVIGKDVNNETDWQTFQTLLAASEPKRSLPGEVMNILFEELVALDNGEIEKELAVSHIQNRMQLFLEE